MASIGQHHIFLFICSFSCQSWLLLTTFSSSPSLFILTSCKNISETKAARFMIWLWARVNALVLYCFLQTSFISHFVRYCYYVSILKIMILSSIKLIILIVMWWPFANHNLFRFLLFSFRVFGSVIILFPCTFSLFVSFICFTLEICLVIVLMSWTVRWPKSIDSIDRRRYFIVRVYSILWHLKNHNRNNSIHNNNNYTHTVNCCRNQMVTLKSTDNQPNVLNRLYTKLKAKVEQSNVAMSAFDVKHVAVRSQQLRLWPSHAVPTRNPIFRFFLFRLRNGVLLKLTCNFWLSILCFDVQQLLGAFFLSLALCVQSVCYVIDLLFSCW